MFRLTFLALIFLLAVELAEVYTYEKQENFAEAYFIYDTSQKVEKLQVVIEIFMQNLASFVPLALKNPNYSIDAEFWVLFV